MQGEGRQPVVVSSVSSLAADVERLYRLVTGSASGSTSPQAGEALEVVDRLLEELSAGRVRAAEPSANGWTVNVWVKEGILLGFRIGEVVDYSGGGPFSLMDKSTFPPRRFSASDGVRVVPGGSTVRRGAYLAPGVVCMPPMFVNVGAYVGEGSMIDSHALVGSCAQIGKRVHLSAGAQIGGVLEPVGALPVVVEDDVLVGGNCGVFEGTVVGAGAVLAPGTVLTRSIPVYDLVNEIVVRASADSPLTIPPGAVVVPGSRPARGEFAAEAGIQVQTPVIVKYRDAGTDAAVALENALR